MNCGVMVVVVIELIEVCLLVLYGCGCCKKVVYIYISVVRKLMWFICSFSSVNGNLLLLF